MSDILYISNVRLSFPHLAEPQKNINEQPGKENVSYNGDFIFAPDHPGLAQFMQRYGVLAMEKWKEHAQTIMGMIQADRRTRCYGRGEEVINKKTFLPYEGYPGNFHIAAGRSTPPQMIETHTGDPVDPANTMAYQQVARKLYGGCRVNIAVKPWLQDNKHGRGIRCDLVAVQFAADDKPFGDAATDASGMFGAVQAVPGSAAPGFIPAAVPLMQMPAAPFAAVPQAAPLMSGLPSFLGG